MADPSHYGLYFVHWEQPPRIEQEVATVNVDDYQYEIIQNSWMVGKPVSLTTIYIHPIDPELRRIENIKSRAFHFKKHLFDFKTTTKEKIINRVKTVLVFQ